MGRTDAIKEEGFNVGDCIRCPTCSRPLSMLEWLPPYRVELESWGKHYGDVADIGDVLIVSERFVDVFRHHELRGLESIEPVDLVKVVHRRVKPTEPAPRYFKATVVRSPTMIDQRASGYVWQDESKVCPECLFDTLKRYDRLVIKEETWNGDDIFFPRGGNGPITSDRFRTTFHEQGLVGAVFIPTAEDHYDFFPWESAAEPTR
ncbi:imm11 family protein [Rubinisphaera margarita]|uniref:imm11 family protein n=1 Tax=Rubinisphaera margarita TaxID=2909586 RepID=UPI001EE92A55|nr:DUF1629 domain-containing protein [Rubinisphaera margarita]MCG6158345.1 hypothetical protein [Rubinisphaera margarita]